MKKNIVLIIIILVLILGLVGTIVATISMYNKNNDLKDEITSKSQEIEQLNTQINQLNENLNTEEEFKHKLFDVTELGNENLNVMPTATGDNHLHAYVDGQGNAFVSVVSNDYFKYPEASYGKEYKIEGTSGKVYNTKVMMMGQGGSGTVFMIMEDGTVEYLDNSKISEGKFVSAGKLEGLEKVVDLVQVSCTTPGPGWIGVAAIDVDGNLTLVPTFANSAYGN